MRGRAKLGALLYAKIAGKKQSIATGNTADLHWQTDRAT